MIIYFGLGLDEEFPFQGEIQGGVHYAGPNRLLRLMEIHFGFQGLPTGNDHLRIEQYRQVTTKHFQENEEAFYGNSFLADQMATATDLLSRRDELLLSGWNFKTEKGISQRLKVLAELEAKLYVEFIDEEVEGLIRFSPGFSDRFVQILFTLKHRKNPVRILRLVEPLDLLPYHFQRLFKMLEYFGTRIEQILTPTFNKKTDLNLLQKQLRSKGNGEKANLKGDASLLLIRAKRETDCATYIAKLLKQNTSFHPTILTLKKNRTLDNALIQEGLPCMGILSASSARPMLQIIKLAPAFLWEPIDPFKIMEFVTLKIKPLEEELSNRIAKQMAQSPGIDGDGWFKMIRTYFEELEENAKTDPIVDVNAIQQEYNFWFRRRRFRSSQSVPVAEVIDIYQYLHQWAFKKFEAEGNKNQSLLVLSEQANRIKELLETLPENTLSYLELERIIRTIFEPSPVLFREQEVGFYPFVHHTAAFIEPVQQLVWWNFVQEEPNHFFSRWYKAERDFLESKSVALETPKEENARLIWHRSQPILNVSKQLVLIMPERVEGKEVHLHPLFSDLQAAFDNLDDITIDLENFRVPNLLKDKFNYPTTVALASVKLGTPKPYIHIPDLNDFLAQDYETYTSLDALFYYPYQWVFKYKTKLRKSSILSLVKDHTLLGNLAHRFFENLLKQNIQNWGKAEVENWIDGQAAKMFGQEGAVLLMYGREPDKVNFLHRLKYAAWSLVSLINNNGWQVKGTELNIDGNFQQVPVRAKADLVLVRNQEAAVVDLKWRGVRYRESMIKNEEDLQLVLYSKLVEPASTWAHTAYFIIEKGKIIARNTAAFAEVNPIKPDAKHSEVHQHIIQKMDLTFNWRKTQVKKGFIEIRCTKTQHDLEDAYEQFNLAAPSMDMLEMKDKDAPFDDYQVLINLVS